MKRLCILLTMGLMSSGCVDDINPFSDSEGGGSALTFMYTDALYDVDGGRVARVVDAANKAGIRRFIVTWDRILPRSYASGPPNPSNLLLLRSGGKVIHNVAGWWRTNGHYDQPGDAQRILQRHLSLPISKGDDLLLAWEWPNPSTVNTIRELAPLLRNAGYTGKFYANFIGDALDVAMQQDWDVILAPSWIDIPRGNFQIRNWDGRQDLNDPQQAAIAIADATAQDWIWTPGLVNGEAELIFNMVQK